MASHLDGTCAEHKLSVTENDNVHEQRVKTVQRAQWLRAALLGANDGLLSTTSLMLGVGAAKEDRWSMILSGLAGTVAGACSMAVGEFVSVSTQRDIEKMASSQWNREADASSWLSPKRAVSETPTPCHRNQDTYQMRSPAVNVIVVEEGRRLSDMSPGRSPMMRVIAEDSNARKGLSPVTITEDPSPTRTQGRRLSASSGLSPMMRVIAEEATARKGSSPPDDGIEMLPNPVKAAGASAMAFVCGSLVPLLSAMAVSENKTRILMLPLVTSIALVLFGGVGAYLGGSPVRISALRVLIGGWISMAITYGLLKSFDLHDGKGKGDGKGKCGD